MVDTSLSAVELFIVLKYNEVDKYEFMEEKKMKQYIVDAFTNKPFAGNPAAVCVMDS